MVNHEAASVYLEKIQNIIKKNKDITDQVFSADETGLWWKKISSRTFISKKEKTGFEFKVFKNCVLLHKSIAYREILWQNPC